MEYTNGVVKQFVIIVEVSTLTSQPTKKEPPKKSAPFLQTWSPLTWLRPLKHHELAHIKVVIEPLLFHELFVVTLLHYPAMIHNHNVIGLSNSR